MPTKQSKAKATVHSTPPGAVKVGKRWIVPLEEMKGKGFLRLEANAIIKEVLANKHDYLNDKERAVRLCVNASTVCRWRKRVTAGQDPVQPPAGGTPPVNRHDIDADIKSITDADGDLSACEIRDKLAHDFGKVVCPQTVRNHLDDMGLTFKKFRRVPAKYDEDRRKEFAKKELARWHNGGKKFFYVFMDEFWCNATHRRKGKYVAKGARKPVVKCNERHVPKVNTYAMLCEKRLVTWDMPPGEGKKKGVTKAQFIKFFKQCVGPWMANLKKWAGSREIRFMLDGAAIHDKVEIASWASKYKASLIPDWPSHSPDLNPIENIFTQVKDRIGKELQIYDMKNKEQSQKKISAKRDQVVQGMSDVCAQFVESFPRRLEKCADTGGNHTGY